MSNIENFPKKFQKNGLIWVVMGEILNVEGVLFVVFYIPSNSRSKMVHDYSVYAMKSFNDEWIHILNVETYNKAYNLAISFTGVARKIYEILTGEK